MRCTKKIPGEKKICDEVYHNIVLPMYMYTHPACTYMYDTLHNMSAHHIDASMKAVVNLVAPNDRVTPSSDLNPGQRVAIDFVVLQNTTSTSKEVHASLLSTVDFVVLQRWVALSGDPHTSVRVGIDLVLYELSSTLRGQK